ncbi:SDR family NAD(P)-dependent oxidoreductase [Erythrobacter sp. AP23]|uniref:SDR family NAD(P)-dependent oxidoreductase n=1 Tax=Erythrobacter sp. AP23 TaxID=499656 RepID=UPI00076C6679|nr:SDR family NAD(P)-dependent oxidoreductase [Erythrobacter sp. AP23]KWV95953.1 hypothetical protein ASS64_01665 [Erythrobacter sp. AP23]
MAVVMTGGTRGLGRVAAQRISSLPGRKIMGVRGDASLPPQWEGKPLDLASLASVRSFCEAIPDEPITHLVLNAGGQRATAATRTVDGFETTFATNHLAHYLLLRLVMPRLGSGAHIVITSSGTHDPREKTGVPPPRHADAELLAHPDRDPEGDRVAAVGGMRAYSASKLCNLMTARYLAATNEARAGNWSVFAYDPGLTPGTGLVRSQPWIVRTLVWPLLPLFVPFAKSMNTLAHAGRGLSELATAARAPDDRVYCALRKGRLTWPDPSELASDEAATRALWEDSAQLVGLI